MKLLKLFAIGVLAGAASLSQALELRPYSAPAFAEAQSAGKPFAVLFHADWCPTCRAQEKTLNAMKGEAGLDLTVFVANYDTERELKRRFGIRSQSTLVALRGQKITARVIGDTSAEGMRAALKSAF